MQWQCAKERRILTAQKEATIQIVMNQPITLLFAFVLTIQTAVRAGGPLVWFCPMDVLQRGKNDWRGSPEY